MGKLFDDVVGSLDEATQDKTKAVQQSSSVDDLDAFFETRFGGRLKKKEKEVEAEKEDKTLFSPDSIERKSLAQREHEATPYPEANKPGELSLGRQLSIQSTKRQDDEAAKVINPDRPETWKTAEPVTQEEIATAQAELDKLKTGRDKARTEKFGTLATEWGMGKSPLEFLPQESAIDRAIRNKVKAELKSELKAKNIDIPDKEITDDLVGEYYRQKDYLVGLTRREGIGGVMTVGIAVPTVGAIIGGAAPLAIAATALKTVIAVSAFMGVDEAINWGASKIAGRKHQWFSGESATDILAPEDTSQAAKDLGWMAQLVASAIITGGGYKALKSAKNLRIAEKYYKDKLTVHNIKPEVTITPEQLREFHGNQRPEVISKEISDLLKDLGLSRAEYVKALKNGLEVSFGAEKLIYLVDKPYFKKLKSILGIPSVPRLISKEEFVRGYRMRPSGLIEAPKEGKQGGAPVQPVQPEPTPSTPADNVRETIRTTVAKKTEEVLTKNDIAVRTGHLKDAIDVAAKNSLTNTKAWSDLVANRKDIKTEDLPAYFKAGLDKLIEGKKKEADVPIELGEESPPETSKIDVVTEKKTPTVIDKLLAKGYTLEDLDGLIKNGTFEETVRALLETEKSGKTEAKKEAEVKAEKDLGVSGGESVTPEGVQALADKIIKDAKTKDEFSAKAKKHALLKELSDKDLETLWNAGQKKASKNKLVPTEEVAPDDAYTKVVPTPLMKDVAKLIGYKGRKFRRSVDVPTKLDSYWTDGSKDTYYFYHPKTGEIKEVHSNHPFFEKNQPSELLDLGHELVLVKHTIFNGHNLGLTFYMKPQAKLPEETKLRLKPKTEEKKVEVKQIEVKPEVKQEIKASGKETTNYLGKEYKVGKTIPANTPTGEGENLKAGKPYDRVELLDKDGNVVTLVNSNTLSKKDLLFDAEKITAGEDVSASKSRQLQDAVGSDPVTTLVAELFQNSFDVTEGVKGSQIEIFIDGDSLEFRDNGKGMSPEVMKLNYVTLSAQGTKGEEDRGGLGLAKIVFMGWPDKFRAVSIGADAKGQKWRSVVSGTREEYMKKNELDFDTEKVPADTPTGTVYTCTMKDLYRQGLKNKIVDYVHKQRTKTKVLLTDKLFGDKTLELKSDIKDIQSENFKYPPMDIDIPGGSKVKVYYIKERNSFAGGGEGRKEIDTYVYNKGLLLQDLLVYERLENDFTLPKIPQFRIEIHFTKTPPASDNENYPFRVNRSRLSIEAKKAIVTPIKDFLYTIAENLRVTDKASLIKVFDTAPTIGGVKMIFAVKEKGINNKLQALIRKDKPIFLAFARLYKNVNDLAVKEAGIKSNHEFAFTTNQKVHGFRPVTGLFDKNYVVINPFSFANFHYGTISGKYKIQTQNTHWIHALRNIAFEETLIEKFISDQSSIQAASPELSYQESLLKAITDYIDSNIDWREKVPRTTADFVKSLRSYLGRQDSDLYIVESQSSKTFSQVAGDHLVLTILHELAHEKVSNHYEDFVGEMSRIITSMGVKNLGKLVGGAHGIFKKYGTRIKELNNDITNLQESGTTVDVFSEYVSDNARVQEQPLRKVREADVRGSEGAREQAQTKAQGLVDDAGVKTNNVYTEAKEHTTKQLDKVINWIQNGGEKPKAPTVLYRGVYKESEHRADSEEGKMLHVTPWKVVASRGGKGAFGDPRSFDIFMYTVNENPNRLFYRGGALSETPFESTRIDSTNGITWSDALDKAKALYEKDIRSGLRDDIGAAAAVRNDFRNALYELDLQDQHGRWKGKAVPKSWRKEYPDPAHNRWTEAVEKENAAVREYGEKLYLDGVTAYNDWQVKMIEHLGKKRTERFKDFLREIFNGIVRKLSSERGSTTEGENIFKGLGQDIIDAYKRTGKSIDKALGEMSTRLGNIHPTLRSRIREFEYRKGKLEVGLKKKALECIKAYRKMSPEDLKAFDMARKNANGPELKRLVTKYHLGKEYHTHREIYTFIYTAAKEVGMVGGYTNNYHAREVKNLEGLRNFLYKTNDWDVYELAFQEYKQKKNIGRPLTQEEQTRIINTLLRGDSPSTITLLTPDQLKRRYIKEVTPEIDQFFSDSDSAFLRYITDMVEAIEARRFFGRGLKDTSDLENSIGAFVMRATIDKHITPAQSEELYQILHARFNEQGTHGIMTAIKNVALIDTLGSVFSAVRQLADYTWALYKFGLITTGKSAKDAWTGKSRITKEEAGISRIAVEFSDMSKTGKLVDYVFESKLTGFAFVDKTGKEMLLNGAFIDAQKKLANPKTREAFIKELEVLVGDRAPQAVKEFEEDKVTYLTEFYSVCTLADYQPIWISEMPELYAKAGNGRIFYMLKSFTLKMFDIFRREAFQKIKTPGKRAEGIRNLIRLTTIFLLANAGASIIQDLLLGRDIEITDAITENIWQLFSLSRYFAYRVPREGVGTSLLMSILPPAKAANAISKDIIEWGDGTGFRVTESVPFVGKIYYWRFGKGSKMTEKWRAKEAKAEASAKKKEHKVPSPKQFRLKDNKAPSPKQYRLK